MIVVKIIEPILIRSQRFDFMKPDCFPERYYSASLVIRLRVINNKIKHLNGLPISCARDGIDLSPQIVYFSSSMISLFQHR